MASDPTDDAQEFAAWLEAAFAETKTTKREAARRLAAKWRISEETVRGSIYKWLRGEHLPNRQRRADIAQVLGFPYTEEMGTLRAELAEIRATLETMSTRREAFRTELARQLKSQTDLLATLTAAGVELRGLIVDLREAREATPERSPRRRPA